VRALSGRGEFAKNWWGKEFLSALAAMDPYDGPSRLGRGRSYARRGQVLDVQIGPGRVAARVQGSRPSPYRVRIDLRPIAERSWRQGAAALGARPEALAALVGGALPPAAAELFLAQGTPLLPGDKGDLETSCSCPDWANPCKHVAAVYYLVAEELDRDPLVLLRLRGIEREAFLAACLEAVAGEGEGAGEAEGAQPAPAAVVQAAPGARRRPGRARPAESLPKAPAAFWGTRAPLPALPASPAAIDAPLVRGLGEVAFWRSEEGIVAFAARILAPAAAAASGRLGEEETGEAERPT
jgi:uncharacterized Zn finger protein